MRASGPVWTVNWEWEAEKVETCISVSYAKLVSTSSLRYSLISIIDQFTQFTSPIVHYNTLIAAH